MKQGDLVQSLDDRINLYLLHSSNIKKLQHPPPIPWFWNQIGIILEITDDDQNSFSKIKRSWCKILIPTGIGWCSPELVNIKIIHSTSPCKLSFM